jgi:hypothetical protein
MLSAVSTPAQQKEEQQAADAAHDVENTEQPNQKVHQIIHKAAPSQLTCIDQIKNEKNSIDKKNQGKEQRKFTFHKERISRVRMKRTNKSKERNKKGKDKTDNSHNHFQNRKRQHHKNPFSLHTQNQ